MNLKKIINLTPAEGSSTVFMPIQLEDTVENRETLFKVVVSMVGGTLTDVDMQTITSAIDTLYKLPKSERSFAALSNSMKAIERDDVRASGRALSEALISWVGQRPHTKH